VGKQAVKRKSNQRHEILSDRIVIDESRGLVFHTEDELYDHFLPQIQLLEKEYFQHRSKDDIHESEFESYEMLLNQVLDDPDEVWENATSIHGSKVYSYVGRYQVRSETVFYVALAYVTNEVPSFVYLHFPSNDIQIVDHFRRGTLIFDRVIKEVEQGSVDGDALGEGDDLAVGLYRAMLTLRSERDIVEAEFKKFEHLREPTIEEADEIWRSVDLDGNVLVTFVRAFPDESPDDLHYIVVTVEDPTASSHALLFSFPSCDATLIERYRHGENLQAEEVVQEASH
jgi:hypothetical protein